MKLLVKLFQFDSILNNSKGRSICSLMFFKQSALNNFAVFSGKHLCWGSILIK